MGEADSVDGKGRTPQALGLGSRRTATRRPLAAGAECSSMRSRRLLPLAAALLAAALLAGCMHAPGGDGGGPRRDSNDLALPLVFLGLLLIVGVVLFVVNLNSSPLLSKPPPPPAWKPVEPPAEPNWFQGDTPAGPDEAKRPAPPPPAAKARRRQP
jgi:hypothetical protein